MFIIETIVAILIGLAQICNADETATSYIDCQLTAEIGSRNECISLGCLFDDSKTPRCHLNSSNVGYFVKNSIHDPSDTKIKRDLYMKPGTSELNSKIKFVEKLLFTFDFLSVKMFRFRITDPNSKRFEVPIQSTFTKPKPLEQVYNANYQLKLKDDFNLTITRKDSQTKLIDTSIGGLLFSDYYLQFYTRLSTDKLYGLSGDNNEIFRRDMRKFTSWKLSSDGMHPFYMVVEPDGKAHGVLLLNSNEMIYNLLPDPAIVWKTIGGIFDFYVFVGDSPEEVVQLYTSFIGRPMMPPFWALGFQLSRYGYKNTAQIEAAIKRTLDNNVPLDVQYVDIDSMDQSRLFTIDPKAFAELPAYINQTRSEHNLRWSFFMFSMLKATDPKYRQFSDAYSRNLFVKWPAEVPVKDRHNPSDVPTVDRDVIYFKRSNTPFALLDFFNNQTHDWWIKQFTEFHRLVQFDAIVINYNDPQVEQNYYCPDQSKFNQRIPYPFQGQLLRDGTLCMCAVQGDSGQYRFYDVRHLYSISESEPTLRAVQKTTGKRGLVVSDTTFISSGRYTAHTFSKVSSWSQLQESIADMMKFNLFGINFVGTDICGYSGNPDPLLCLRWYQLGAYYPLSRSHNEYNAHDQDPGYWKEVGHPEVTEEAVKALRTRYQLLHYLYTRLYRAHVNGETLVRSLMHEFPTLPAAHLINYQFFLGPSILVAPFVLKDQTKNSVYVPPGNWFKFRLSGFLEPIVPDTYHLCIFNNDESHRPLLFREGSILPIVANLPTPLNTHQLRQSSMELWILPNSTGFALGDLFWDDGESINSIPDKKYNLYEFCLDQCTLTIVPQNLELPTTLESSDGHLQMNKILIAVQPSKIVGLHSVEARLQSESLTTTELKVSIVDSNHLSIETTFNLFDLFQIEKPVLISFYDQTTRDCFI